MTYKTAQMERVFLKLQIDEKSSKHHRSGFVIDDDGKKLFPPLYFSKGHKDIPAAVARKIRQQMFLNTDEFDSMVRCVMSRKQYLELRKASSRG